MQRVTMIKIRWLFIVETLAPASCLTPTSVDYRTFLAHFSLANNVSNGSFDANEGSVVAGGRSASGVSGARIGCMDEMYGQRRKLETVFYFFDSNNDGVRVYRVNDWRVSCSFWCWV